MLFHHAVRYLPVKVPSLATTEFQNCLQSFFIKTYLAESKETDNASPTGTVLKMVPFLKHEQMYGQVSFALPCIFCSTELSKSVANPPAS